MNSIIAYNLQEIKLNQFEELKNLLLNGTYFSVQYCQEEESWQDKQLPCPTFIRSYKNIHNNKNYIILIYSIEGYFKTRKNRKFLKDIKEKITKLWGSCKVSNFYPFQLKEDDIFNVHSTNLKEFLNVEWNKTNAILKRLNKVNKNRENLLFLSGKDKLFEAARWEVYELKIHNNLTYENTLRVFEKYGQKLNSTFSEISCKAKNVFQWTKEHYTISRHNKDYYKYYYQQIRRIKENRMTKEQQLKEIYLKKEKNTTQKINDAIIEIITNNLKLTITNVSKISKISRMTLNKEHYKNIILKAQDKYKKS